MKRCPECRRDYFDETLLYCLDDGTALLEGPASANEPATAIMSVDRADLRSKSRWFDKKLRAVSIVILAVFFIAGFGFGIYKFTGRSQTNISFEAAKFTRLTNSGKVLAAAISPDGKWLVYANDDGDQQSLWLQQVANAGSNTRIPLPTATLIEGLAFSPDGNNVYYTALEMVSSTGTLYQVPVIGGTARKMLTGIRNRVSFSPDGKQITYTDFDFEQHEYKLLIANADGTGQRQVTPGRGSEFFLGPSWSPDGKTIAVIAGTVTPFEATLAAVSVETGELVFFSSQKFIWADHVNWLPDGRSILVLAAEKAGSRMIWQISYPSGEAQKISNDLNGYSGISMTADSNAMAAVQGASSYQGTNSWTFPTGIANIWTAPINDTAQASQVTNDSDRNFKPSWTRDGKIVYVKVTGSSTDLYMVDPRGGSPKQLTSNSGSNYHPAVSPDGRFIVFTSNRTGTPSLWRTDIDGSNPKQLTFRRDSGPSFSPDGQEIIYYSIAGERRIWKVGIDGGEPVQLTDTYSDWPVFSPDGKQFVCSSQVEPKSWNKIVIMASGGGAPLKTFTIPSGFSLNPRWMPDGRSIVYGVNKGGVTNLWAQPTDGGEPKQITKFTSDLIQSFDFSRDGKQIAFTKRTGTSDVVLISGFRR